MFLLFHNFSALVCLGFASHFEYLCTPVREVEGHLSLGYGVKEGGIANAAYAAFFVIPIIE